VETDEGAIIMRNEVSKLVPRDRGIRIPAELAYVPVLCGDESHRGSLSSPQLSVNSGGLVETSRAGLGMRTGTRAQILDQTDLT